MSGSRPALFAIFHRSTVFGLETVDMGKFGEARRSEPDIQRKPASLRAAVISAFDFA
jgi:hypothetical protein